MPDILLEDSTDLDTKHLEPQYRAQQVDAEPTRVGAHDVRPGVPMRPADAHLAAGPSVRFSMDI
jgi:hypothetical protein